MNQWLDDLLPSVYRFALRLCGNTHLAEDLSQEALLRAWKSHSKLRDGATLRVWTIKIAHNLWRDWQRQKWLVRQDALNDEQQTMDPEPEPTVIASERDEVRQALVTLDRLPERQREVLYLVACEQMSIAEVAETLGMTYGAVKTNLSLARKRMREQLEKSDSTLRKERDIAGP